MSRFTRTKPFDAKEMATARRFMRPAAAWNVRLYQATNGMLGSRWRIGRNFLRGVPVGLVTTTGRRSGKQRVSPLIVLRDGKNVVVVASQGGMPRHPDWYFNVQANPEVTVQIKGDTRRYVTHTAEGSERSALWAKLVKLYPSFDAYQGRAEREIPVVVCTPLQG